MQEDGKYLLVVVTVLAMAALGILAAAAKGEKSKSTRPKDKVHKTEATSKASGRSKGARATSGEIDEVAEELQQSRLILPPPDEPRIEAVAPKNERRKVF